MLSDAHVSVADNFVPVCPHLLSALFGADLSPSRFPNNAMRVHATFGLCDERKKEARQSRRVDRVS